MIDTATTTTRWNGPLQVGPPESNRSWIDLWFSDSERRLILEGYYERGYGSYFKLYRMHPDGRFEELWDSSGWLTFESDDEEMFKHSDLAEAAMQAIDEGTDISSFLLHWMIEKEAEEYDDYEATHGHCQKCGKFAFVADEGICRECYVAINGEK